MTPTVIIDRVVESDSTRLVYIICPYCKKKHLHGWPYDNAEIGYRTVHCSQLACERSYYVPTPAEMEVIA